MEIANDQRGMQPAEVLEKVLGSHLERLIGTRYGIGGLPMTFPVIGCLALLAERESEITEKAELTGYSRDTLLQGLYDLGFTPEEDLETAINLLIEKGYTIPGSNGFFSSVQPVTTMIRLLDHLFSGMNAMALVIYCTQIIEEVKSGRKDLVQAANQLHQVLQMKGILLKEKVAPKKTKNQLVQEQGSGGAAAKVQEAIQPKTKEAPNKLAGQGRSPAQEAPRIIGTREVPADKPEKTDDAFWEIPKIERRPNVINPETAKLVSESRIERLQKTPLEGREETVLKEVGTAADQLKDGMDSLKPGKEEKADTPSIEGKRADTIPTTDEISDDYVERRIAQFTEDLMVCPLCSEGRVQVKQTLKKKYFYVCSNKRCIFISWGKPFFLTCPLCKNPFLIEASDSEGKTYLKCPRATCLHKQSVPGINYGADQNNPADSSGIQEKPRKKILVRKRVVRKKR